MVKEGGECKIASSWWVERNDGLACFPRNRRYKEEQARQERTKKSSISVVNARGR